MKPIGVHLLLPLWIYFVVTPLSAACLSPAATLSLGQRGDQVLVLVLIVLKEA